MIRLPEISPSATALAKLKEWQAEIDAVPDYVTRVVMAKSAFPAKNRGNNTTFNDVRAALSRMCNGARRCAYCEDSVADEVEHMRPKDLFPEEVFSWANYVYACGPCNGPKNNKFAVVRDGAALNLIHIARKRKAPVVAPPVGRHALIDPRIEDPMQFLMLDLIDTFQFVELPKKGTLDFLRASYTIDVLRLNEREYLREAREEAFSAYRARLSEYAGASTSGEQPQTLARLKQALLRSGHPTVWREMQRQHNRFVELRVLFDAVPAALDW